jgi:hypothetical protein
VFRIDGRSTLPLCATPAASTWAEVLILPFSRCIDFDERARRMRPKLYEGTFRALSGQLRGRLTGRRGIAPRRP